MIPKTPKDLTSTGLLLTVVIFIGHYFLPQKQVVLHPAKNHEPQLYGFVDAKMGKSSQWVNEETSEWECNYKPYHSHGCGWELYKDPREFEGIDLTAFSAIEVALAYRGPASRIRVYLRNFNEAYAGASDVGSTKFMSASFPVVEAQTPVLLNLFEFSVATWWLRESNVSRQLSLPEFDRISNIGVDFIEPGVHRIRVEKVALIGRWIKTKTLLIIVLSFWMTVFLLQGILSFYGLYKKSQHDRHVIRSLQEKQNSLEEENRNLEELADTDPLTGAYNRAGLQTKIEKLFSSDAAADDLGVMLLDIDHFKHLNDTHGHDMGDKVLKALATVMLVNIRDEDLLARWGGEEFILISRNRSMSSLCEFAEKLREISATYAFGADFDIKISASIGLTIAHRGEPFEAAFKRADQALYRAKQGGRNRVEYEQ